MGIKLDLRFSPASPTPEDADLAGATQDGPLAFVEAESPLGPLELLKGKWLGTGFNQLWRPLRGLVPSFLELNYTRETLEFTEIEGPILNRGFIQGDINVFGLTYLQQVEDLIAKDATGKPLGLHLETGMWLNIPATNKPPEPATVARLANIPHGTSLLAQGTATSYDHAPEIPDTSISPFVDMANRHVMTPMPAQILTIPNPNRTPPERIPGLPQTTVNNPNSRLKSVPMRDNVIATTELRVSTMNDTVPKKGGGVSNIGFLEGVLNDSPNARVTMTESTFWIQTTRDKSGAIGYMLQYTQFVVLRFNSENWPHVSIATLIKQ